MRGDRLPILHVFDLFCSFLLFFALWLSSSAFCGVPGKPLKSRPFETITIGIDSARRGDSENHIFETPFGNLPHPFCTVLLVFGIFCTILLQFALCAFRYLLPGT